MIAMLTGTIAHKSPDHIILDVNGVGYRVLIPFSTYYELPEEGGSASLQIHTSVREDPHQAGEVILSTAHLGLGNRSKNGP